MNIGSRGSIELPTANVSSMLWPPKRDGRRGVQQSTPPKLRRRRSAKNSHKAAPTNQASSKPKKRKNRPYCREWWKCDLLNEEGAVCGKYFQRKKSLFFHQALINQRGLSTHGTRKGKVLAAATVTNQCVCCGQGLRSRYYAMSHIACSYEIGHCRKGRTQDAWEVMDPGLVVCPFVECGLEVGSLGDLQAHIRSTHLPQPLPLILNQSHKAAPTKQACSKPKKRKNRTCKLLREVCATVRTPAKAALAQRRKQADLTSPAKHAFSGDTADKTSSEMLAAGEKSYSKPVMQNIADWIRQHPEHKLELNPPVGFMSRVPFKVPVYCGICGYTFVGRRCDSLRRHCKNVKHENLRNCMHLLWKCNLLNEEGAVCGERFRLKKNLFNHQCRRGIHAEIRKGVNGEIRKCVTTTELLKGWSRRIRSWLSRSEPTRCSKPKKRKNRTRKLKEKEKEKEEEEEEEKRKEKKKVRRRCRRGVPAKRARSEPECPGVHRSAKKRPGVSRSEPTKFGNPECPHTTTSKHYADTDVDGTS